MTRRKRIDTLETARRKWQAEHIPMWHVSAYLLDVLNIVREEAGAEVAGHIGGRMVREKLQRVEALRGGHR